MVYQTVYERDAGGNLTKVINPDGSTREYTYDEKNNLIKEKDENGNYTYYIYDDAKRLLLKKVQPLNGTAPYTPGMDESAFAFTTYEYYNAGETGNASQAKGLVKKAIAPDPLENITTYTYDENGNVQTVRDARQNVTQYGHNRNGWKTSSVSPLGFRTDYEYDGCGRLIRTIWNKNQENEAVERIVYDEAISKTRVIFPNQYNASLDSASGYNGNHGYRYIYTDKGNCHSN